MILNEVKKEHRPSELDKGNKLKSLGDIRHMI
jgi:hypothetical protein